MSKVAFVREIDDLGRIVIPREYRNKIFGEHNSEGKKLEIFLEKDGSLTLKPCEPSTANREEEIQEVKKLGERIGYGNLMDIASALMSMKSDGIKIEHASTVFPCIKKEEIAGIMQQVLQRVEEIRAYGID